MKSPGVIVAAFAIVLVAVLAYFGGGKQPPRIGASAEPVADTVDPAAVKDRIARCEAWVGMSKSELRASWGPPSRENVTRSAATERIQLVYRHVAGSLPVHRCGRDALPETAFVYVEGDRVTAIQEYE